MIQMILLRRRKNEAAKKLEESLGGSKKSSAKDEEEERRQNDLKKEMTQITGTGKVGADVVGGLLPTNLEELEARFASEDDEFQGMTPEQAQKRYALKRHDQAVHDIQMQIAAQKQAATQLKQQFSEIENQLDEMEAEYNKVIAYNQRIIEEIKKFDALETPENTKQLQMLRALVSLNENLKNQETKFKANCKRQLTSLKSQIEELDKEIKETGAGNSPIDVTFNEDKEKLQKMRQLSAKKTRDIALVERKIDEVPARTELTQYQRQFVELYEQVASKLNETRQYYTSYNTLEDTKMYLSKELSILNSIHDNYKNAIASKDSRSQFLESLSGIVGKVAESLTKIEQTLATVKQTKTDLNEKYTAQVEKERLFYKETKDFLEECRKNELLQAKLNN